MHPPQIVCTEITQAASIIVTFNTIYAINASQYDALSRHRCKEQYNCYLIFFEKKQYYQMTPDEGQG
jgi:hypothetical protein